MYFPYFRGKQYERIAIRNTSHLMKNRQIIPIIEPVKRNIKNLDKVIDDVSDENGSIIVIANPQVGDFKDSYEEILDYLEENYRENDSLICGIILNEYFEDYLIDSIVSRASNWDIAFIHSGYNDHKHFINKYKKYISKSLHLFVDQFCSDIYKLQFRNCKKAIIKDGFCRRSRNRDHPEDEFFSDLHLTYKMKGMDGFGDFLIVGDDFSEGGGPAYAVAIHVTYIDPERDDAMYIHHFLSDSQDTPTDPAGKFAEALDKLIFELDRPNTKLLSTRAMAEFRELHEEGHFPGLGVVKKLSMQHHIETLNYYFKYNRK